MKIIDFEKKPCEISNLDQHVEDSDDDVSSWPMLIYKIINPVMHFIIRIKDGKEYLYIVSKEKWHGLYVSVSGNDKPPKPFYRIDNWLKITVVEEEIDRGDNGKFFFFTRKHGTKLFLIILALIGLICYLVTLFHTK